MCGVSKWTNFQLLHFSNLECQGKVARYRSQYSSKQSQTLVFERSPPFCEGMLGVLGWTNGPKPNREVCHNMYPGKIPFLKVTS